MHGHHAATMGLAGVSLGRELRALAQSHTTPLRRGEIYLSIYLVRWQPPPFGKSRPGFRSTLRLLRCSRLDPPAAFARPAVRNATRWLQVRRCCGACSSPLSSWRCSGTVPTARKIARRTRDFGAWLTQTTYGRDIQWLINVKGGGGRNHTQVIGRNHTPVLPLPQCHKDR